MRQVMRRIKEFYPLSRSQRGQALIIFTFSIVGLLALVGIVTDAALVYVNYDHLRRAVDAGAVSAVNQYREGRRAQELYDSAVQAIQLQLPGMQNVRFYWCSETGDMVQYAPGESYDAHDDDLCHAENPRKRVRVEAELPVDLVFLSLVWGNQVTLHASAEAEAAVLNMVLLLDTSESMAYDTCRSDLAEPLFFDCLQKCVTGDPSLCPQAGVPCCEPFDPITQPSVRWAAYNFVDTLMRDGVDRVAVYHFDKTPVLTQSVESFTCEIPNTLTFPITLPRSSGVVEHLTTTKSVVLNAITDTARLNVYVRPQACDLATGECCDRPTHVGGWWGEIGQTGVMTTGYGYRWASTNVGGGLREAVGELVSHGSTDAAIWVIVLLSDGAANATDQAEDGHGWWTCPSPFGSGGPDYRNRSLGPFCRDPESDGVATRHCPSQEVCDRGDLWYTNPGHTYQEWHYDADDYARDIADLASSQQVAIYTIGFGPKVIGASSGRPDAGERLLRYIADVGDDGDLETAPCGSDYYWDDVVVDPVPDLGEQCGNYYYAPDADALEDVFEDIASRIFSRITQ